MAEPCVLGVDIGGTALKLGLFSADGALLADLQRPTPQPATPGSVCMELVEAIDMLDPERKAELVGIGLPGPMDAAARVARVCINLPGWEEVPLAGWLEPRLKRKVTLANDGNCALVGEAWKGAARGFQDVVLLTLGTGVGGGVMLGGALFTGPDASPAIMPTYGRLPVTFSRGEGAVLYDTNDRAYLDGVSGIAVTNLGHQYPRVTRAHWNHVWQR